MDAQNSVYKQRTQSSFHCIHAIAEYNKKMPSLKKRKNIRENRRNAVEDGGWDGGSKLEGELLKMKARNQMLEDSWRNVLLLVSLVIMSFCFYNAWLDQHNNQYLSVFEVSSGLISAAVMRFCFGTPSLSFELALQLFGVVQFFVWVFLTMNEYIYHVHCLPLGAIIAFLGWSSFAFLRSIKSSTQNSIDAIRRLKERSS